MTLMTHSKTALTLALFTLALFGGRALHETRAAAQGQVSRPGEYAGYASRKYDGHQRTSFYVPARDGTKLAVDLFRPTTNGVLAAEKLPVVWMHTPYNRRPNGNDAAATYPGYALQLVQYGYNVAVVDFRGVYASFGQNRAYNRGEWLDAARMDAYDVTEWFAKQSWSSGQIGMWGCSATGGSQVQAASTAPPSLKAIFPMSAEFDAYSFQVNGGVAPPVGAPLRALPGAAARDKNAVAVDGSQGVAELQAAIAGHLADGDRLGDVPFRDSVSGTTGQTWWIKSSPYTYLDTIRKSGIGVYAVATWDEAGTKHGAFFTFRHLGNRRSKLLVGPMPHCDWDEVKADTGFDIVVEELRFFDYWLKGVRNGVMDEAPVTYYTYNAPKGQEWRRAAAWPLPNEVRTKFYLGDGALTRTPPVVSSKDTVGFNRLTERATSTTAPKETAGANTIFYETPTLTADMEVTGHPVMHLWLSATVPDADIVARLDDVAPDGSVRSYNMHGQLRASARVLAKAPYDNLGLPWHSHKAADSRPLVAGQAVDVEFEMLPVSYIFKGGHRLRLTVFFSDPKGAMQPDATARVTVLHAPDRPSSVTLPIVPVARGNTSN